MADTERMKLVIEARETASREIKRLRRELNALGGPPVVKARNEIKKLNRQINQLSGTGKKASPIWSKFIRGIALGNIAANAAAAAMRGLRDAISEVGKATLVAAQVEELGNVMQFVGQRTGYTSDELDRYYTALRESGIAQKETVQGMLRAMQAEIDLETAVKFGRVAQDAATIGLMESSEGYMRLINAVAKLFPRLLREMGIIVNLNIAYRKYSKQHGVTVAAMTQTQRKQAMINAIFEKGEIVAGAYEAAMFNVSKRLRSMPRWFQDVQVAIGQHFNPALEVGAAALEEVLKDVARLAAKGVDLDTKEARENIIMLRREVRTFTTGMVASAEVFYDVGRIFKNVTDIMLVTPLLALIDVGKAVYGALSDPFNIDAWTKASAVMTNVKDNFEDDFKDIEDAIAGIGKATDRYRRNIDLIEVDMGKLQKQIDLMDESTALTGPTMGAEAFAAMMATGRAQVAATFAEFDKLTDLKIEDEDFMATDQFKKMAGDLEDVLDQYQAVGEMRRELAITAADEVSAELLQIEYDRFDAIKEIQDLTVLNEAQKAEMIVQVKTNAANAMIGVQSTTDRQMQAILAGGINNMVRSMVTGRGDMAEIFKGMAQDFMVFFIQKSLATLLDTFIPGIGALLGGVFDTPKYDKMAMDQGADFAEWFRKGVMENMGTVGGPLAVGGARIAAAPAGGGGQGIAPVTVHMTFTGNVMTPEFVEAQVAPMLERLVMDGRGALLLDPQNITGDVDVRVD